MDIGKNTENKSDTVARKNTTFINIFCQERTHRLSGHTAVADTPLSRFKSGNDTNRYVFFNVPPAAVASSDHLLPVIFSSQGLLEGLFITLAGFFETVAGLFFTGFGISACGALRGTKEASCVLMHDPTECSKDICG